MITRNDTSKILNDLAPLIAANYRKREMLSVKAKQEGKTPPYSHDQMFWADHLAMELGAGYEYYKSLDQGVN